MRSAFAWPWARAAVRAALDPTPGTMRYEARAREAMRAHISRVLEDFMSATEVHEVEQARQRLAKQRRAAKGDASIRAEIAALTGSMSKYTASMKNEGRAARGAA